jgi:hypothetical protein
MILRIVHIIEVRKSCNISVFIHVYANINIKGKFTIKNVNWFSACGLF